jgi:hypothetical protein
MGGLRTPRVDVPDARYVARISPGNPLAPGMKPFTDELIQTLYGGRDEYRKRARERLEQMVQDRFVLSQDCELMLP